METNYIIILDYSTAEVIEIKLTDEQKRKLDSLDDLESFLKTLEKEYGFRMKDCYWMSCDTLTTRKFGF